MIWSKRLVVFLLTSILFIGCSTEDDDIHYQEIEDVFAISCPELPIEIMSNLDEESIIHEKVVLNFFCIVQVSYNLFYMYYETYTNEVVDFDGVLRFAYSTDGIHWNRYFPNKPNEDNIILSKGVEGVSVLQVPDKDYPFRMIGYGQFGGVTGVYMWKSKDGIHFSRVGILLEGVYDTQQVAVLKDDRIKLYTRLWSNNHHNRRIGVAYFDINGNLLSLPKFLQDNYLYNSAASTYTGTKYDFLFPTYFNNMEGGTDEAYIKALIVDGYNSKEIQCEINRWIEADEPWVLVAPGIIDIAGQKYIAYQTKSWSHDSHMPADGISKYKMIKIDIK